MTADQQRLDAIVDLRTFVPAKDFEQSKDFYQAAGFKVKFEDKKIAEIGIGRFVFLLQDLYDPAWAENCAMHLFVRDLDVWWKHLVDARLPERYGVPPLIAPKTQEWGLEVGFFRDPSNVLWHVALAKAG